MEVLGSRLGTVDPRLGFDRELPVLVLRRQAGFELGIRIGKLRVSVYLYVYRTAIYRG